jgi:hypothetical protein
MAAVSPGPVEYVLRDVGSALDRAPEDPLRERRASAVGEALLERCDRVDPRLRRGREQASQDRRERAVGDRRPVMIAVRRAAGRRVAVELAGEAASQPDAGRDRLVERDAGVAERARRDRREEPGVIWTSCSARSNHAAGTSAL